MAPDGARYVIVGAGAAGMAAAAVIRRLDPDGCVTVVSEESDAPYYRPLIPFLISGEKTVAQMALAGRGPFVADGVQVLTHTRAVGLDTAGRKLVLASGKELTYDRLLVATGSKPFVPPDIDGLDTEGVLTLRTLADARLAAARSSNARRVVMLGGGMLNLKAAFAFLARGLAVTMAVRSPQILSQLMEPEDAAPIRKALDAAGLEVITGVSATNIHGGPDGVRAVSLDDGRTIDAQIVCIGKGVRPHCPWVPGDRIRTIGGAVATDAHTCTSDPAVFAAGDVAASIDPVSGEPVVTGLWTHAVEMGRCAGANMAGRRTIYAGTFGILNATQVAGVPFVSMGKVHADPSRWEVVRAGRQGVLRKLVFSPDGRRLVGAVLVGDIQRAGLLKALIHNRVDVRPLRRLIETGRLHYGHLMTAGRAAA